MFSQEHHVSSDPNKTSLRAKIAEVGREILETQMRLDEVMREGISPEASERRRSLEVEIFRLRSVMRALTKELTDAS